MESYNIVGLYDHNKKSYNKIKQGFKNKKEVAIVHATGTGKSFNALQYAYDNKNKKIIYVVPYNSIIEHLKQIIKENSNLKEEDFQNVEFRTYASFIKMSEEELKQLEVDILILDEFHHIGAPIWGAKINTIINSHPDMNILGMSAYTVRDRGTSYERDMVNPFSDELFSNKVVSNYDLCDAMIDGVLPKPIYKSAYIHLEKTLESIENRLEKYNHNSKDYKELTKLLKDIKKRVHEAPGMAEVFKKNIKKDGKYIYFCPLNAEYGVNDIDTIQKETEKWIKQMGLKEDEYILYTSISQMGEDGKKNRNAFYNDLDLDGKSVDKRLRIMFAINQYNEGTHVPNIDGVIMGRSTQSDIVFFEQLGRALAVRGKTKEVFDYYESKSIEELKKIAKSRNILLKEHSTKEDIIELLVAPIIIDLANNIEFIKNLENNLKDRIKLTEKTKKSDKRILHITNAEFDIEMINQDLFEIVRYMYERMAITWEDKYELAKKFYENYGHLRIPYSFCTINGYEEDPNGVKLGAWIRDQRQLFKGNKKGIINNERIKLLEEIKMEWELSNENIWKEKYELAKKYYEYHGHLKIPKSFCTVNGYEEDKKGINLGEWIATQRCAFKGIGRIKLSAEKIRLLEEIKMEWEVRKIYSWEDNYKLAKEFYKHHGHLRIPQSFCTVNGYEKDPNGVKLGIWLGTQRSAYKDINGKKISEERIKLLEKIGMEWGVRHSWESKYELAKKFYEHHGHLRIPQSFCTVNGYEEDPNGAKLGVWISNQRSAFNGILKTKISEKQIKMLEEIKMEWKARNNDYWNEAYELAKKYYEHYGHLRIPSTFRTINGYEEDPNGVKLGTWIFDQRQLFKGNKKGIINKERIKLLEKIKMEWELSSEDIWKEKYELAKKYYEHYGHLRIPQSFCTKNGYEEDPNGVKLGVWISRNKEAYKGNGNNKINDEQIKMLEKIGMDWFTNSFDIKLQKDTIDEKNKLKKQKEILNRMFSLLSKYDESNVPNKEELNDEFIKKLSKSDN